MSDLELDIWTAASIGDADLLRQQINSTNVNLINQSQWSCLMYAAWNDHAESVQYLLDQGALVHLGDDRTALMLAACCGHYRIIEILLKNHPDLSDNVKDQRGYNSLFYATFFGHYECCKTLLELDSDPNVLEMTRDFTPLLLAVEQGHERIVELLLSYGADLDYVSPSGSTVFSVAKANGHERLFLFFKSSKITAQSPPALKNHTAAASKIEVILHQLNLKKYSNHFENMDFDAFMHLSEEDLRALGISLVGPRRKLISAISKLQLGQTI